MAKVRAAFFAFQSCLNVVAVCGAQISFLASNEGSTERFSELSAQALTVNNVPHPEPLSFSPIASSSLQIDVDDADFKRKKGRWNLSSLTNTSYHNAYHPLFEIDSFINELASVRPKRAKVKVVNLGHSAEGREMMALRISERKKKKGGKKGKKKGKKQPQEPQEPQEPDEPHPRNDLNRAKKKAPKPAIIISGAQHAREWVATSTALYLSHALASDPSEYGSLNELLKHFDFHIIPVPNPDGYVYTWDKDRFWYKNRMKVGPDERCRGLDMNRNWGYEWSPESPDFTSEATSNQSSTISPPRQSDPCSHWYPGHRPYEAPEVNNIALYIQKTPRIKSFFDLRSYGQMLSVPFSHSCEILPADAEDLLEAALGAAQAVRKKHGTMFTTGRLCSMLYPAPGNIVDWMYGEMGVKFSFAIHLRDTGTYGYTLPEEWIRPVGQETSTMIEYLSNFMSKMKKLQPLSESGADLEEKSNDEENGYEDSDDEDDEDEYEEEI